jgi:hypothetical protein
VAASGVGVELVCIMCVVLGWVAASKVGVELVGILCVCCVGWLLAGLEWNW